MERQINKFLGAKICLVLVLILIQNNIMAQNVGGGNAYACGGGCYNQCFLLNRNALNYPCYFKCLGSCFSPSSGTVQYYCQIGCTTELCLQLASDGARMERCLGNCGRTCGA